ncbi:MAG: hypothetical protein ACD_20C00121G0003 [uncultured bacterium]|nr:MAG: hypothetical protein ACD_20C00121G0003 [uncultured bacterium]
MIKKFNFELSQKPKCRHEKITPTSIGKFCPDCGKEVFISWVILRCKGCSSRRQASPQFETIIPIEKFCSKCGERNYSIEKKSKLEFYEINYAVLIKEEFNDELIDNKTQVWIEENSWSNFIQPKLIPLFK